MGGYQIDFKQNCLVDNAGLHIEQIGANRYQIHLKNGKYQVRIYDGDMNHEGDVNVYTKLNGKMQMPLWAGDKVVRTMDYEIEIENEILDIEFSGKYVCIQGIDIAEQVDNSIEKFLVHNVVVGGKYCLKFEICSEKPCSQMKIWKNKIGSGKDPEEIAIPGNGWVDGNVECCEEYEYQVACVDELGFFGEKSEIIRVQVRDEEKVMPELCGVCVETVNEQQSKITWKPMEAFKYRIYRKTELSDFKLLGETELTEYVDDSMITDREYIYGVEAFTLAGRTEMITGKSQVKAPLRQRQMELLNRGGIAVRVSQGMFLAFRLFADEYENAEFNIYADGKLLITLTSKDATNYLHKEGTVDTVYEIRKVCNGIEEKGAPVWNWNHSYFDIPIKKPDPYTTPDGRCYEYTANDASVADLDGDGEYEIVLKWDCNGKDNSHKGYSGIVYLDAYKLDGTLLWRIDMGKNIRCGAHYTQFMVYDFDGDGCAEMVVKTADGTMDYAGNVVGNGNKDYRNSDGFIIEGPEYLSLIDGSTGVILDTVEYDPPRGDVSEWGDSWGNRVDRFLACVAYLDGVHPSAVMCRGYYDHGRPTHLAAYDVVDKKLIKKWKFVADKNQNVEYTNQGFHNLAVADVDGDGCDEIIYGACVIDHDGMGLYSTGLGHGDAMHVGKFTKESKGYDYFGIHEDSDCPYGIEARDAGTGKILFGKFTGKDTTRGLTAKIDPRYPGNQMWAFYGGGLYNFSDGTKASEKFPENTNFAIWWDGDLLRELLDHDWFGYETNVGIPKIYKWNWQTEETEVILSTDGVLSNNGTKGNPCIQASIVGDWREDVIFRGKDSTFLRLYTTTDVTEHRIYTLMHDAVYRLGIAWQNTAYNQPPQTGFYIGPDMETVPVPNHKYVGKQKEV